MNPKTLLALLVAAPLFALPPLDRLPLRAAVDKANAWNDGDEHITTFAGLTGSMKPYLIGNEFLLLEKYHQQSVAKHDLIHLHRWDQPDGVVHEVTDVSDTQVKTQGVNCMFSDGWQDKGRIRYIVRRVIRIQS